MHESEENELSTELTVVVVVVVLVVIAVAVVVPRLRRGRRDRAEHPTIGLPDLGALDAQAESDAKTKGHVRDENGTQV